MTKQELTGPITMIVGKRRYSVPSIEAASAVFVAARDKAGTGASRTPMPRLYDAAGKQFAYISYNGRVWPGNKYDPAAKPLCEAVYVDDI